MKKRDCYLYVLRDGHEIVYYGITNDRERKFLEHKNNNKRWTNYSIVKGPFYRENAENEEKLLTHFYQDSHGGKPPLYNNQKTTSQPHLQESLKRKRSFLNIFNGHLLIC